MRQVERDVRTGRVIDAAMAVHSALGPGLLENAYEACLLRELQSRGSDVRAQVPVPLLYREARVDVAYRIDLLVDDAVVVELKTVSRLSALHEAQLLSYLRLTGREVGLLINFHALRLKDGIRRIVNSRSCISL